MITIILTLLALILFTILMTRRKFRRLKKEKETFVKLKSIKKDYDFEVSPEFLDQMKQQMQD